MSIKLGKVGTVLAVSAATLTGCGGGGSSSSSQAPPSPPMSSAQSLDTAQVLAQARQTSETSLPYQVNDGALTLTDTSESTTPISVNAGP
jgi:hypothetical protein